MFFCVYFSFYAIHSFSKHLSNATCVPDFPTDIVIVAFYHILQTQQKLKQQGQANLICLERFPTLQFVPKLLWEKEVLYASTYGK